MTKKSARLPSAARARFLDDYLPYLLGHASHELNKDFDRYVKAAGLSPLEWRTLATLADDDGLTTVGESDAMGTLATDGGKGFHLRLLVKTEGQRQLR